MCCIVIIFLCFCLVTYAFSKYLLSTYYMLDIVLENKDVKVCACPQEQINSFYENSVVHVIKEVILGIMETLRKRLSPNLSRGMMPKQNPEGVTLT